MNNPTGICSACGYILSQAEDVCPRCGAPVVSSGHMTIAGFGDIAHMIKDNKPLPYVPDDKIRWSLLSLLTERPEEVEIARTKIKAALEDVGKSILDHFHPLYALQNPETPSLPDGVLDKYDLFLFDLDGTLIVSSVGVKEPGFVGYGAVRPMRNREALLAQLIDAKKTIGIVTNQGGAAFGYHTERDFWIKMSHVLSLYQLPANIPIQVCFAHEKATIEKYRDPFLVQRRKPSPRMIWAITEELLSPQAREMLNTSEQRREERDKIKARTLFIGDRPEDELAAKNAPVDFMWAKEFFGDE